jgi:hypothetical protein
LPQKMDRAQEYFATMAFRGTIQDVSLMMLVQQDFEWCRWMAAERERVQGQIANHYH